MSKLSILTVVFAIFMAAGCRPAAAPVSIGNTPVSVNGVQLKDAPSQPRRPLAEMSWTGFDGTVHKLKDFRGKVVILDFWATYCPPCIEEIPHLNALQAKYGPERLAVIGLHVGGDEDKPRVPDFVERLRISYALGYPEDDLTSFVFGSTNSLPQTAIFDPQGRLVAKITGFDARLKEELDRAVEKALGQNG